MGVVSDVPTRSLELDGRGRDELLDFAFTLRAGSQRRIRKLLNALEKVIALLAVIFVERQLELQNNDFVPLRLCAKRMSVMSLKR